MDINKTIELLREIDCVEISFCHKPHGDAIFVSLGMYENKRIIGNGNSLETSLNNAIKNVK